MEVQRICQFCNIEFTAKTTVTQYCSLKCSQRGYKKRKRDEKIDASNFETLTKKIKPIEELKMKEFLTVRETAILLSCSVRTVYRLIDNKAIPAKNISERMTRIRRVDLNTLLDPTNDVDVVEVDTIDLEIEECYNMTEIQSIYGISEKGLYDIIKRNNIPKLKKGWYSYVPKDMIDALLR